MPALLDRAEATRPGAAGSGVPVALDPGIESLVHISSELLSAQDQVRRQRKVIWQLVAIVRAEQQAKVALIDLLDELLAADG